MTDHSDSPELARADEINAELCKIEAAFANMPKRRKPNRYAFAAVSFLAKMIGCRLLEGRKLVSYDQRDASGRVVFSGTGHV